MGRFIRWFAGSLLVMLLAGHAAYGVGLRLLTEESPPNNYLRDGKLTGLAVEVVQEIMRRNGTEIPIEVMPWARAYRLATTREAGSIGLFMTARTPEREGLFHWVGPLQVSTTGFYARADSELRITSLDDARAGPSILLPRDWFSYQLLIKQGFTNLEPVNTPEQMIRMAIKRRAKVIVAADTALPLLAAQAGAREQDFKLLYPFVKTQGYIAFSLATPVELVARWQRTLDEMKRDSSFARIYKTWFPSLPPPGIQAPF